MLIATTMPTWSPYPLALSFDHDGIGLTAEYTDEDIAFLVTVRQF